MNKRDEARILQLLDETENFSNTSDSEAEIDLANIPLYHEISESEESAEDEDSDFQPDNAQIPQQTLAPRQPRQAGPRQRARAPRGARPPRRARVDNHSDTGWVSGNCVSNIPVFTGDHGINPDLFLDNTTTVMDVFDLVFDRDFLNHVKHETNRYASEKVLKLRRTNALTPNSRFRSWKPVTLADMEKFIAIILHSCISERPALADHWSKSPTLSCNFCPNIMSRDRFLIILSNFHVNNNDIMIHAGNPGYDPLFKVRPVIETLRKPFQRLYTPEENVTVDESICPFRGRASMKVYMPQKPHKYGIKVLLLSEAKTGYAWNMEVYQGAGVDNSGKAVVKRLLDTLTGDGHTVFLDRFFSSIELANELRDLNTGTVGTIQKNRKHVPRSMYAPRLQRGTQIDRHKDGVLVIRWCDKRDVWMVSTRHSNDMITFHDKRNRELTKPASVVDYNKNKFGVDLSDQRLAYASHAHRTVKWWKKLGFFFISMAICNACIIFNKATNQKLSTRKFIDNICLALANMTAETETPTSTSKLARLKERHFPERVPGKKQKRCIVCAEVGKKESGKAKRKDSTIYCSSCNVGLCVEPCFRLYHTKRDFSQGVQPLVQQ